MPSKERETGQHTNASTQGMHDAVLTVLIVVLLAVVLLAVVLRDGLMLTLAFMPSLSVVLLAVVMVRTQLKAA